MKQTAVEWLVKEIEEKHNFRFGNYYWAEINQAKELEKQQMFEFTKKIHVIGQQTEDFYTEEFEKYYNQTFKSE